MNSVKFNQACVEEMDDDDDDGGGGKNMQVMVNGLPSIALL